MSNALISIHPNYVEAILAGTKTVELRRKIPDINVGTNLWIYSTQPIRAVVAHVIVEKVDRGSPSAIWEKHGKASGINRLSFREYFRGSNEAIAIILSTVRTVKQISMEQMRTIRIGFHPPQVLIKLNDEEAALMTQMSMPSRATIR